MSWLLGGLILVAVGAALRRILSLDAEWTGRAKGFAELDPKRRGIYQPIALEVETQAAILGISLNDAFEERDSGHREIAWRLVQLSVGEWDRLVELVAALLKVVVRRFSAARVVVSFHGIIAHQFKSGVMVNYVRMHELLDQLVFGSNLRFQLHLRVLRRASEILSAEFRRRYRYADRTGDRPEELWKQIDLYFHDFDLIAKEALLALRALLVCLPDSALAEIDADLKGVVGRGVRSVSAPVER
jgi:hypothetical protein